VIALGWIALVGAAIPAALFIRNLRVFVPPAGRDDSAPSRSSSRLAMKKANIAAAIGSALANPHAEVLVLDDHSSDRTYGIAADIAKREPRLRVLRGESLPHGWLGKEFRLRTTRGRSAQPAAAVCRCGRATRAFRRC
jgi:chlorobactene glucosyltransferase